MSENLQIWKKYPEILLELRKRQEKLLKLKKIFQLQVSKYKIADLRTLLKKKHFIT